MTRPWSFALYSFALHPFAAFCCKLCKVLDKLVRQPLTAVRSASVLLAHAGKAEIAVDSRIPLHRPGAVRKIDIGIHWETLEMQENGLYFHVPQSLDD